MLKEDGAPVKGAIVTGAAASAPPRGRHSSMHHFHYRGEDLYCEEVPISALADEVGTPFYLYSHATLTRHFRVFDEAFREVARLICFAVKADILMFNVESSQELRLLNQVAGEMGTVGRVAVRVNPDVDPKTHPYISTGLRKSKFGIDISIALEEYQLAQTLSHIAIVGIHTHIGSQITDVSPFVDSLTRIAELIRELRTRGMDIRYLDVGGGLGIPYGDETPPHPTEMARAVIPILKDLGCTILFEPGRVIVGNAGILVTRVLYTKRTPTKDFIIVDAGMNDLIRPSLYGSYHAIQPVRRQEGRQRLTVDVVGPICESGDFLAKDREIAMVEPGELLAVMSAGAYGFTMASNYNARPRAAEVLVRGDRHFLIRARERYEDLIRGEEIPDNL